ncbi:GNAT family N-acetyltransferase [Haloarchaeobius litoreus]|uniref:GNAT family N-acetyltransferase n=1 Tax=Haloarchaeobius litoreus TaxID=755306 RepID=A0ABD6DH87_9EURY|nr:GNAT family N-acetyltransferase [Haloarchaeobius litoreus]
MQIRVATEDDVEAIGRVHEASIRGLGSRTYDDEQVGAWAAGVESADYSAVTDENFYFIVAEAGSAAVDDHPVVGFGTLARREPDGYEADVDAEVTAVYVHPDVARGGVGTALLDDLERQARAEGFRSLGLTASTNAVPFYEAHGYERIRERRHEFSGHEGLGVEGTVVEMWKTLD